MFLVSCHSHLAIIAAVHPSKICATSRDQTNYLLHSWSCHKPLCNDTIIYKFVLLIIGNKLYLIFCNIVQTQYPEHISSILVWLMHVSKLLNFSFITMLQFKASWFHLHNHRGSTDVFIVSYLLPVYIFQQQKMRYHHIISPKTYQTSLLKYSDRSSHTMSFYHFTLLVIIHLVKLISTTKMLPQIPLENSQSSKGFFDFLFNSCNCSEWSLPRFSLRTFILFFIGCGIPNREGRIAGGEFIDPHEFPWLVLVHVAGKKDSVGSLINDQYVLTTANLVKTWVTNQSYLVGIKSDFSVTPFDVKVTTGLYDRCHTDVSSTKHSTEKLIIHPDYHPGKATHNLALIKLNARVAFDRRLSPICLPYPSNTVLFFILFLFSTHYLF